MLWVAVIAGIVLCLAIAAVWKVVEINRGEKKRKRDEMTAIAEGVVQTKVDTLAEDISRKVTDAMQGKFNAIDKKLERSFIDQINSIRWVHKLSADTLNAEKGKITEEVEVFLIKLKKSELEPNLACIRETLSLPETVALLPFSAEKGQGREALLVHIQTVL